MSALSPLPTFDVTLTVSRNPAAEEKYEEVKALVCKVKEGWTPDKLQAKLLSGGHINAIVKVTPEGAGDEEAVVVKVESPNSRIREDADSLVMVMRVAEAGGVGAPVLGVFQNGVIYQFTVGEMLVPDLIPHDAHIQSLIAKQLAKFHNIKPEELVKEAESLCKQPRMFPDIYNYFKLLPDDFSTLTWKDSVPAMTKEEMLKEVAFVEKELEGCEDEVAFCHNDCWWSNQIYDKSKDTVMFIDFDYCHYNYVTRDIVDYFMHGRMEIIPNSFFRMHMFRESEKRAFFTTYLAERRRLSDNQAEVTEADVDKLIDVAKPMELGMVLDRLGVCLFINNKDYPLDYIWIGNQHWDHYFTLKKEYLRLKAQKSKAEETNTDVEAIPEEVKEDNVNTEVEASSEVKADDITDRKVVDDVKADVED